MASVGKDASSSLVSCRQTTSGWSLCSQSSRCGRGNFSELTFQVASFTPFFRPWSGASCLASSLPASCCGHAVVPQQRSDARSPSSERLEGLERGTAAAHGKNLVPESGSDDGIDHARLIGSVLFEQAVSVRGKHLGPFVAVVA